MSIIEPETDSEVDISEPTGMMECFHGALISFLLNESWDVGDCRFVKAALGYANHIAGLNGTKVGSRRFPDVWEQARIKSKYWRTDRRT
jgi:hypothetical protein